MSLTNLADAKVSYEGLHLPAVNLIGKLQSQLQETACQLAVMASALSELQAALLNSTTVEVKLTLSKEDFGRFRSLSGADDNERIRRAVLALIHPGNAQQPSPPGDPRRDDADSDPSREAGKPNPHPQTMPAETAAKENSGTICPSCQSLIDLPEIPEGQWSIEVKCERCGAKSLLKSKY